MDRKTLTFTLLNFEYISPAAATFLDYLNITHEIDLKRKEEKIKPRCTYDISSTPDVMAILPRMSPELLS
jgi:hypothetical protein